MIVKRPTDTALLDRLVDDVCATQHAGKPAHFTRPLGGPILNLETVFEGLLQVAAHHHDDSWPQLRLFAGVDPIAFPKPGHLPTAADGSVVAYMNRLDGALGAAGLVVNDFQMSDLAIWDVTTRLVSRLYRKLGIPSGGAVMDLLAGSYRRGFFGLHKDNQDVLTFVLQGKKRILLWPFETFSGEQNPAVHRQRSHRLTDAELEANRSTALVVEGGPGDVLYWPADWWHVAEADESDDCCVTMALGLFRSGNPMRFVDAAVRNRIEGGAITLGASFQHAPGEHARPVVSEIIEEIHGVLGARGLMQDVTDTVLSWTTAFGFKSTPEPQPAAVEPEEEALADEVVLVLRAPGSLAWLVEDGAVVWSACGRSFRYPAHPGIERLLECIAAHMPITVGEAIALAVAPVDKGPSLAPDVARHLLRMLERHHATRRVRDR